MSETENDHVINKFAVSSIDMNHKYQIEWDIQPGFTHKPCIKHRALTTVSSPDFKGDWSMVYISTLIVFMLDRGHSSGLFLRQTVYEMKLSFEC